MPTIEEMELMRHALGLKRGGQETRNSFVTDPTCHDGVIWERLAARGWATKRMNVEAYGGMTIYRVTDLGREQLKAPTHD